MPSSVATLFGELSHILGVCPCCGCAEIFYLSEARPYLKGKRPRSVVDRLRDEGRKLQAAYDALADQEGDLRAVAAKAGLRTTRRMLKKIDPVFSGSGYDPKDVKVIFDPVTYIVFDGLAREKLKEIALLAKSPETTGAENLLRSIRRVVEKGNFEFKTLRVDHQGRVALR